MLQDKLRKAQQKEQELNAKLQQHLNDLEATKVESLVMDLNYQS